MSSGNNNKNVSFGTPPEIISSIISSHDGPLLSGQGLTSQEKKELIKSINDKIENGYKLNEKEKEILMQLQSNQEEKSGNVNRQSKIIQIEIPAHWYMTDRKAPCFTIDFRIDNETRINNIRETIEHEILKIETNTLKSDSFVRIVHFRYESSKCVFNTKKQAYNDNDKILDVISLNDIPDVLKFNSGKVNGYQMSLKVKQEYTTHLIREIDEIQENIETFKLENSENSVNSENNENISDNEDEKSNQLNNANKASNYAFGKLEKLESKTKLDKKLNEIYKNEKFTRMSNDELELELDCFLKRYLRQCWKHLDDTTFEQEYNEKNREIKTRVNQLYNDEKHEKMGYPLCRAFLKSLMLQINSSIYTTLTNILIEAHNAMNNEMNDEMKTKDNCELYGYEQLNDIAIFEYCVHQSITILDRFRTKKIDKEYDIYRNFQLYSGAANVIYRTNKPSKDKNKNQNKNNKNNQNEECKENNEYVEFIAPTSFSMDVNVAKQFSVSKQSDESSNEMIDTPQMLIVLDNNLDGIICADVSWIADETLKHECEVLVRRDCGAKLTQYTIRNQNKNNEYCIVTLG